MYIDVYLLDLMLNEFICWVQREFAMRRKTTIWLSTLRSMCRIFRWLSSCRASSPRLMCVKPLLGCTTTGTSQTMALSSSGLTSTFLLKLSPPLWRNRSSLLVAPMVAHLATAHGNSSFIFWIVIDLFAYFVDLSYSVVGMFWVFNWLGLLLNLFIIDGFLICLQF